MARTTPLTPILYRKIFGGGGSVTPESIVTATGQMTTQQAADTRQNIDAEQKSFVVEFSVEDDVWSADKSIEEMAEAVDAGKTIIGIRSAEPTIPIICSYIDADVAKFDWCYFDDGVMHFYRLRGEVLSDDNDEPFDDWHLITEEAFLPMPKTIILKDASVTIIASDNTVYDCDVLTSLTISSFPASGKFWIWFTSGATPTTTVGIANFTAEANKVYKITVENGYATYDSWATS